MSLFLLFAVAKVFGVAGIAAFVAVPLTWLMARPDPETLEDPDDWGFRFGHPYMRRGETIVFPEVGALESFQANPGGAPTVETHVDGFRMHLSTPDLGLPSVRWTANLMAWAYLPVSLYRLVSSTPLETIGFGIIGLPIGFLIAMLLYAFAVLIVRGAFSLLATPTATGEVELQGRVLKTAKGQVMLGVHPPILNLDHHELVVRDGRNTLHLVGTASQLVALNTLLRAVDARGTGQDVPEALREAVRGARSLD